MILFLVLELHRLIVIFSLSNIFSEKSYILRGIIDNVSDAFLKSVSIKIRISLHFGNFSMITWEFRFIIY